MSRTDYEHWCNIRKTIEDNGEMTEDNVYAALAQKDGKIVLQKLGHRFTLDIVDECFDRGDEIEIPEETVRKLLEVKAISKYERTFFDKYHFTFYVTTILPGYHKTRIKQWMLNIEKSYLKTAAKNQANIKTDLYEILNHLNAVFAVSPSGQDLEAAKKIIKRLLDWQTRLNDL